MLRLKIETDNDAFSGNGEEEVARLLRNVAARVADGQTEGLIRDANGNTCGSFELWLEREQEVE